MKIIKSITSAVLVMNSWGLTACIGRSQKGNPDSVAESQEREPGEGESKGKSKKPSNPETLATCVGNPDDDEKKPCFQLYLNGMDQIARQAMVSTKSNADEKVRSLIVELKPGRSSVALSANEIAGGELTIELQDQEGKPIENGSVALSSVVIGANDSATVFDKHVYRNDESFLQIEAGDIKDVDAATLDRIKAISPNTFRAVAPRSPPTEFFPDWEYFLSTFHYDGLVSYDVSLRSPLWSINQATITGDGSIFGVTRNNLLQVAADGAFQQIEFDPMIGLSSLSGVTFDSKRNRLVVSSSRSLATYDLKTMAWSSFSLTTGYDISVVTYMPEFDGLFFLSRSPLTNIYTMEGVDAGTGKLLYKVRLPSSFPSAGYTAQESVSFGYMGDFVAMVVSKPKDVFNLPMHDPVYDFSKDLLIYLLDPVTRRMVKTRSPGWELDFDRPASIDTKSCGEIESNYVNPPAADAKSNAAIVSVYEATNDTVDLVIPASIKPWDLLLTSGSRTTKWKIVLEAGASLQRVQAYSWEAPTVEGVPPSVPVILSRYADDLVLLHAVGPWESELDRRGDFGKDIEVARALLGVGTNGERLFQYCYRAIAPISLEKLLGGK